MADDENGSASKALTLSVDPCSPASLAAGSSHALAMRENGTIWAWGENGFGQLGDGTNLGRQTPVQVLGLSHVVALASGWAHSLAELDDGTLQAWGSNLHGQLGDGLAGCYAVPTQVRFP